MRFVICCLSLGLLAGAGCLHRKASAPSENFTDIPGLPKTSEPPPVEVKQKLKPQKKETKAEAVQAPAGDANRKKRLTRTEKDAARKEQARSTQASVPTSAEPKSSSQKLIVTP